MTRLRSPRRWPLIAWIIILSTLLNLTAVWWGLPNAVSWAPDEVWPSHVYDGLSRFFSNGWIDKYPPLHFYALGVVLLPFLALDRLKLVDFGPSPAVALIVIAFRLLTVLMASALIYLVFACGRELLSKRAALFAAAITALLVPFPYYAKTTNLDVPYLFWFIWSLLMFIRLAKTGRSRYYLLFALTAAFSVLTKDQALGLYVLSPLAILWVDWTREKSACPGATRLRRLPFLNYLKAAGVAAGAFFLGFNIPLNFKGFIGHVRLMLGPASETYQMVPKTAAGYGHLLVLTFHQVRFCLGWPLLVVGLAGLALALFRKPRNRPLLTLWAFGLSYLVFFILLSRITNDRYVLPIAIILALFAGSAFDAGLKGRFIGAKSVVAAAVGAHALLTVLAVDVFMLRDGRYDVERWLRTHVEAQAIIGAATPLDYLPRLSEYSVVAMDPASPDFARSERPDYIILATQYIQNLDVSSPEEKFFVKYPAGPPGYRLALKQQTHLAWSPLGFRWVWSNLKAINPEIRVYERLRRP